MYLLPNKFAHSEAKNGGAIIRAGAIIGTNTVYCSPENPIFIQVIPQVTNHMMVMESGVCMRALFILVRKTDQILQPV